MFISTFYSFLTRNLAKNFHETHHISFKMYISSILWLILVFFLNFEENFSRQYLITGMTVLIGWFTLLGLFAPVFYYLRRRNLFPGSALFDWNGSQRSGNKMQSGESTSRLCLNTTQLNVRTMATVEP